MNFGHSPWWYGGHFCQKVGKNPEKKLFTKEIIKKKEKKLGWVKNTITEKKERVFNRIFIRIDYIKHTLIRINR